jgi:hypothetical protein
MIYLYALLLWKTTDLPFKTCLKRLKHKRDGHPFEERVKRIERIRFENHPGNTEHFVFKVSICECKCGMIYIDSGHGFRDHESP